MLFKGYRCFSLLLLVGFFPVLAQHQATHDEAYANMTREERNGYKKMVKETSKPFQGQLDFRQVGGFEASMGTIQYDGGSFDAIPTLPVVGSTFIDFSIGNRFNTHNGNTIPLPITLTMVSFFPALVDGSSMGTGNLFVSMFGAVNTAGTMAAAIDDQNQIGVSANTFNVITFVAPNQVTGTGAGSFQVGIWNPGSASTTAAIPCATDCVGLDTMNTVAGQGFHGMMVQDINGNSYQAIPGANALIRPTGNVVPVELMNFTIE